MSEVRVWEDTLLVPTYEEGPPDPNPPFDLFVRPAGSTTPTRCERTSRPSETPRSWRTLNLENEYLVCTVLPDLGGHLYRCVDKLNGAELFYANPSIKFAQIAYRGAWTALGVEFNFPVSHNWMTASPVDFAMTRRPDGSASVWVGNIDRPYGMQWRVELTLRPGRAVLEQRTTLYNRSLTRQRFYWWTNAGVEVSDDFADPLPDDLHRLARLRPTWTPGRSNRAGVDLSVVGNHKSGSVSRFAHGSRESFMGVYHPKTKAGVVHYSAPTDLPAKKIWSWGGDADGLDWRRALSDDNSAYVEVQAGLFRNQETYGFLEPQETVKFTEVWIPFRDLDGLTRANPDAVLHLVRKPGGRDASRSGSTSPPRVPGATLLLVDGGRAIATENADLTPEQTFVKVYAAVPRRRPVTLSVRDRAGRILIEHTEGRFDFAPAAR